MSTLIEDAEDVRAMEQKAVKERPILFSGAMVRAILSGQKTQTRRLMKPQPDLTPEWDSERQIGEFYMEDECVGTVTCHYGKPGDRLWVREAFEKWALSEYFDLTYIEGDYSDHETEIAWFAWQAAQSVPQIPEHIRSIKIPTDAMEQEFQNHYRRGFDAGKKSMQSVPVDAELDALRKDAERLEWLHSHVRLLTKNWDWVGLVGFRQAIDVQMRLTEKEVNRVAAMQERQS